MSNEPVSPNKVFSRPVMLGIFIFLVLGIIMIFSTEPVFHKSDDGQWLFLSIPFEFILFALTLFGVALFHHYVLQVALTGLTAILIFKLGFTNFNLVSHLHHEWEILINLLGLLLGFALLAKHFEESKVPDVLPKYLPSGWMGGFVLLCLVFVLSSFLDNIAAAMIGGTIALVVFKGN
ncbi:citrate transporter, partial [bacterium]|nr:citrate transporter [bacterium]